MTDPTLLELVVVDGDDRGKRFSLRPGDLRLGRRREGESDSEDAILFEDRSVSSAQAFLHCSERGVEIEHRNGATNPTLVNGEPVERCQLELGDRIQLGNLVMTVHDVTEAATATIRSDQLPGDATVFVPGGDATVIRPPTRQAEELVLRSGIQGLENRRFPLPATGNVRLGRHESCEVMLPEPGVSRLHAELERRGAELWLHHRSSTNATHLGDQPVTESIRVFHGDRIVIANHVVLEVVAPALGERPGQAPAPVQEEEESLQDIMEKLVNLDRKVSERFVRTGSFLDIDVVDSYGMKARAERPEHIIVSFERFRAWAIETTEQFSGRLLNSNGDELMIFFESALDGVRAASAVLQRLDEFNSTQNLLKDPFRVRAGLHSGTSAVDLTRGVAYSPVLDVAGHLQKQSEVNGLLISETAYRELPEGLPFAPAAQLEKEELPTFRLTESVD